MTTKKVCAVFGYGPGIGAAVARRWSNEGYHVAIMSRSLDKVKAAETEITNCHGFACDVTNPTQVQATVELILKTFGVSTIDCLIYNAGTGVFKPWNKVTTTELEMGFRVNVTGLLSATQSIVPLMKTTTTTTTTSTPPPCILVTGATASLRGKPITAGFAPVKGAQRMLCQSLARDLGPTKGIHVAYFIIDGMVGPADGIDEDNIERLHPDAIATTYWTVANQSKSCWTFELDVRPAAETW